MRAIHILLRNSIDYAGLFPPAALDMKSAVENYASYRAGEGAWALGRFVLPVSRLDELTKAGSGFLHAALTEQPWQLAALAGSDLERDLATIAEFNKRERNARVETIELKASATENIQATMQGVPDHLQAYIEIPIEHDPEPLVAAVAKVGARAKVRTGGVTSDAFPGPQDLMRFLVACIRTPVAFKATAGLHHPLRAEYRLTYAPDSSSCVMFGFLNLFLATAFLKAGLDPENGARILQERDLSAFRIDSRGVRWRDHRLDLEDLQRARDVIVSFGSCSFVEPLAELHDLHLLEPRVHQR